MRAHPIALVLIALVVLGAGCDDDEKAPAQKEKAGAKAPAEGTVKTNRLAKERSPYLRQHQHNPVDWYPWGDEAFERARQEDKPILLSVGYAACHWCHVMEHESFEDEATAKALNAAFVCIKVDREERPDVDRVYMNFVQLRSGRGGWPMTVLLTHDRKPFWGGTYLPANAVRQLCENVTKAWKEHRKDIEQSAEAYAEQVAHYGDGPDVPETDDSDARILETMRNALGARFDRANGGYGSRPKFPPHTVLLYFLDAGGKRMRDEEREQVFATLDAMERGGIQDQAGGGFHRYSTDERWFLPHFEKMLYDNALLAQAYAGAYALTQRPRYRRAVERIFGWLEREMKQDAGGYASSLDADTEGEEGTTYTWTAAELAELLSHEDYVLVAALFGIEARGNFQDEATHERTGRNILHWVTPLERAAAERGMEPAALRKHTDALFERLMVARNKRAQPGLDDKVITGWNGLLLSAFARAGRDLGDKAYLERGRELAGFLLAHSRREDGTLLRFPRGSGPEIPAFGEDYVHLIEGLLDLAEATKEDAWADSAGALADRFNDEFQDQQSGGFYATSAQQHETLIARGKETWDSPIPSENGVAARINLRLFARTGEEAYRRAADRTLSAFRPLMAHPRMTSGTMALLRALTMRMEMEATGKAAAERGDVHAHQGVVQVDVFLERAKARPGARVGVVVRVALDEGWHVNASQPSKDLVATRLAPAGKAPATLDDVRFPVAVERTLGSLGGGKLKLYEDTFEIRAVLVVPEDAPPGPRKIPLLLSLQACDARTCQPPQEIRFELPLRFGDETGERRHPSLFK